jgi:hypothetical protein
MSLIAPSTPDQARKIIQESTLISPGQRFAAGKPVVGESDLGQNIMLPLQST